MASHFEKEAKVMWLQSLGPIVFGLAITLAYVNCANNCTPKPKPFPKDVPSSSAPQIPAGQAALSPSQPTAKNIYGDPPREHRAVGQPNLPVGDSEVDEAIRRQMRETLGVKGSDHGDVTVEEPSPGSQYSGAIASTIKSKLSAIDYCYQKVADTTKLAGGKVVVGFTINSNGEVSRYEIEKTTLNNGEVEQCMLRMLRRWKFPPPDGGSVDVSYPFIFTPKR